MTEVNMPGRRSAAGHVIDWNGILKMKNLDKSEKNAFCDLARSPDTSAGIESRDPPQFEALVHAYSKDLYRFGYWLCRDRWQAEDLVQETLMAAWRSIGSVREKTSLKAWLFSILRNEHFRCYRKKRLETIETDLDELQVAGDSVELERVELEASLRALPESLREPLLLQVLGGFSGREIAGLMNLSEENVMTRLSRARQHLYRSAMPVDPPLRKAA
ncbi:MAG: sigma-70 family RNA polymerase sigma factor [Burkholderiales bacterium]